MNISLSLVMMVMMMTHLKDEEVHTNKIKQKEISFLPSFFLLTCTTTTTSPPPVIYPPFVSVLLIFLSIFFCHLFRFRAAPTLFSSCASYALLPTSDFFPVPTSFGHHYIPLTIRSFYQMISPFFGLEIRCYSYFITTGKCDMKI